MAQSIREATRECASLLIAELRKAGFNPVEPRVPAGSSDGGQWTSEGTSAARIVSDAPGDTWNSGIQVATSDTPGVGHNQGPPLEEPPKIPLRQPASLGVINDFLKSAAYWLSSLSKADRRAILFLAAPQATTWLANKYLPSILSYLDPPKTWDDDS